MTPQRYQRVLSNTLCKRQAAAFVLSMLKINAAACRSRRLHSVSTALLALHSAHLGDLHFLKIAVGTQLGCHSGVTGVLRSHSIFFFIFLILPDVVNSDYADYHTFLSVYIYVCMCLPGRVAGTRVVSRDLESRARASGPAGASASSGAKVRRPFIQMFG